MYEHHRGRLVGKLYAQASSYRPQKKLDFSGDMSPLWSLSRVLLTWIEPEKRIT